MKKISLDTNREFSFDGMGDAEAVFNQAKEIAEVYGYVTIADICDLIGAPSNYMENTIGWSLEALNEVYIHIARPSKYSVSYMLYFPQCDWKKYGYTKETEDAETPSTGEPINVTITVDKWYKKPNVVEQVISALFKDPEKIKDRPVFISII